MRRKESKLAPSLSSRARNSVSTAYLCCLLMMMGAIAASESIGAERTSFGANTIGGTEGEIVRVTSLAEDGPGSLRHAVTRVGPKLIVFEVGGVIHLRDYLEIKHPFTTIAGQTAPPPGITLSGAGIVIKTHDVVLEHLRIRIGDGPGPSPHNRDGISVEGRPDGSREIYNVLIDHCSVSWAIDEGVTFIFPGVLDATIRRSIVAETLSDSSHPKGPHSMGLLVAKGAKRIAVLQNLLAHNMFRNPVIAANASAFVANNLIYDFGLHAIHVYGDPDLTPPLLAAVGNVGIEGPSNRGQLGLVYVPSSAQAGTGMFLADNIGPLGSHRSDYVRIEPNAPKPLFLGQAPFWPAGFEPLPAREVEAALLDNVGAWPADRDSTDQRIINQVRSRSGRIIDSPKDVGGLAHIESTSRKLAIPGEELPSGSLRRRVLISDWLETYRKLVEGR